MVRRGRAARWLGAGLLVGLLSSSAYAVPMLRIDVGGQGSAGSAPVGSTVTVSITLDGVPAGSDGNGLYGFGFRLAYDAALLAASQPVVAPIWTGLSSTANDPGSAGATANLFQQGIPLPPLAGDGIPLATIDFDVLAGGVVTLTLAPFTGTGDNVLFDGTDLDTTADVAFFAQTGTILPEPATAWLAAAACAVAALSRTRRSR